MPIKKVVPLEAEEQKVLVEWMEYKKIKFSAIPNSTYTKSWNQKRKNKEQGLRKGLPDLLVCLNDKQSKSGAILLFVEMKRIKGSSATPEQKEWIRSLNEINNVECMICYGADEAIDFISRFLIK